MAPKKKKSAAPEDTGVLTAADYLAQVQQLKGVLPGDFALMSDDLAALSPVKEWIPTGSIALDRAIGGGWPVGRITELAAWEGVGKTTLVDQSIAQCQAMGGIACLVDSEQARDPDYTRSLGVDPDKLIIQQADTVEAVFSSIERLLAIQEAHVKTMAKSKKRPPPMFIVWDSLGGTPTIKEFGGESDDRIPADAARVVKKNFQRLSQRVANARVCLLFTNHFYQEIGPFAQLKTYGGSSVRYYTSLRVWLTKKEAIRVGDQVFGHQIEAKLKKTRVSKPRPPAQLGLVYGVGIYNAFTLFEWGRSNGAYEGHRWLETRGAWSYLMLPDGTHETFQGGFIGFAEVMTRRPEVYAQMTAHYFAEAAHEKTTSPVPDHRPLLAGTAASAGASGETEAGTEAEGEASGASTSVAATSAGSSSSKRAGGASKEEAVPKKKSPRKPRPLSA